MFGIEKVIPNDELETEQYKVVKLAFEKGGSILRHNFPGVSFVFIVTKGHLDITLNDSEKHNMTIGKSLIFDGDSTCIEVGALEESEVFVTFIKK